ncbi:MAG: protein-glutamate O-methyltransferase CheR [Desulfobacteraceae bacterium]|nr:protein-glutamate O-methyltransferase CheR [Desulfobacteraceae bacterium]
MLKIKPDEITLFSNYIHKLTGISIDQSKAYLLETRFGRLLQETDSTTYADLYHKARMEPGKHLEKKIIDAITTNETLFFRDTGPFDLLRHKIIPELIDSRIAKANGTRPSLKIWSAACSTGQEVYSIAIVLKELLAKGNYNIKLLGTDISDAAVTQASYGDYNKFEIERGLPKDKLIKYFSSSGSRWKVSDELRSMATFRKINLLTPFTNLGKWDIVFCRNVAIYFTLEDRQKLFSQIAQVLEPDGYLIIGSTESLTGVCPSFVPKRHLRTIFYTKR